ncbi:endonuclease [Micromonospora sp. S4605]|uniref:DISARM system phospholipase D-like protein DrmC n=1 Tax=Micromonospora sp. S4605 TaxID=1420897 RepID=UPI000D6F4D72|nr:DISARM system phospholipase D-like protein DrmC [Micromonospora sp. S4605]PWU51821.1 endonuclease [Micromonospora sp. S4605]
MSWYPAFEAAAEAAVHRLGPSHLRVLADRLGGGWPEQALRHAVPVPGFADAAGAVLAAQHASGMSPVEAAAYLRGLAAGHAQRSAEVRIESVWSGPSTHPVPVRSTAQVLVELVGEARGELLLMTYSATPYQPLLTALAAAVTRGVRVTVVVETRDGAGGALQGTEPAAAFGTVPGVKLWHWPKEQRAEHPAKMHAKIAVADRRVLLVSSANLTQSGVNRNIEAGLLVRGGTAPQRAAEHIAELQSRGVLTRLRNAGQGW